MKRSLRVIVVLFAVSAIFVALAVISRTKALHVADEILKPCLSPSRSYDRTEAFGAFDPSTSMLPHWTITYSENPTDVDYENPSVTVNFLGEIVDSRSKEVAEMLIEKGYSLHR